MPGVAALELSVVVPALNERENLAPLVRQVVAALTGVARFEIIVVDDGSTDGSTQELLRLMQQEARLRALSHARRAGQSAAVVSGVRAARAPLVATLDGDLQNDPVDLVRLYAAWLADPRREAVGLVAGQRRQRRDRLSKRLSSRIANKVRRAMLQDETADSGCGLKLFPRELFLTWPVFAGLHRFLPALAKSSGKRVLLVPVGHRPRSAGTTKYGIWNRLWVGIGDLLALWWLLRRRRDPGTAREFTLPASSETCRPTDSGLAEPHPLPEPQMSDR
ncbi:MAG TPA: glycosyltransferase family 2 protein [Kiloniellales bacterium]|nr:glycosyltransferase family 2 protein [Kiloniellales bacterium]